MITTMYKYNSDHDQSSIKEKEGGRWWYRTTVQSRVTNKRLR